MHEFEDGLPRLRHRHKTFELARVHVVSDAWTSRLDTHMLTNRVDHFLQLDGPLATDIDDLVDHRSVHQSEDDFCGIVGAEELQFAPRIEPQRPARQDVVDGVLPEPGSHESAKPRHEPPRRGVTHRELREIFVEAIRALPTHVNRTLFPCRFRHRAVWIHVT